MCVLVFLCLTIGFVMRGAFEQLRLYHGLIKLIRPFNFLSDKKQWDESHKTLFISNVSDHTHTHTGNHDGLVNSIRQSSKSIRPNGYQCPLPFQRTSDNICNIRRTCWFDNNSSTHFLSETSAIRTKEEAFILFLLVVLIMCYFVLCTGR